MGYSYAHDGKTLYKLIAKTVADNFVYATFQCTRDGKCYTEILTLSKDGAMLIAEGDGEFTITFPVFLFDGKTKSDINVSDNICTVSYNGHTCISITDGTIYDRKTATDTMLCTAHMEGTE